MVSWQDPYVLAMSARAFILSVHTMFGVYVWEFLTSLDFDWAVITGRKKLNASIVIYWLARYCTLIALVIGIRICNVLEPTDCETWNFVLHSFAYGSTGFLSGLLFLRVAALSQRNIYVMSFLSAFYLAYWAMVGYGIYHSEAVYVPELFLCAAIGLTAHRANTIVQFSFDMTCLLFMLFFLFRGHRGGSLWKFLVQQGVVYLVCIAVGYLLASVFLILNLNDAVSQIPNVFALLINAMCATRMQRGLTNFYEPSSRSRTWTANSSAGAVTPAAPRFPTHHIATGGINVTVDVEHEDEGGYPMQKYANATNSVPEHDSKAHLGQVSSSPSCGLPEELWTMILQKLGQRDRFIALGVCQAWRSLAISTPSLWTDVEVRCSEFEHKSDCVGGRCETPRRCSNLDAVELMLLWSSDLALNLTIDQRQFNGSDHSAVCILVAKALSPHAARIATLHVDCDRPKELDVIIHWMPDLVSLHGLSLATVQHLPEPIVLRPAKLTALEHLNLGNTYLISVDTLEFTSLRSLATTVADLDMLFFIFASVTDNLEVLTLNDLNFSRNESASAGFGQSVARPLARLRELHLTGVTPELEEIFSRAIDHTVYKFMSVSFVSWSPNPSIAFYMLDAIAHPTHVDVRSVSLSTRETAAIVVRDATRDRARLFIMDVRNVEAAFPVMWSRLKSRSALTLALPIALWNVIPEMDFPASEVTTLILLVEGLGPLDSVSEPHSTSFPDLQHLIIEARTAEGVRLSSSTLATSVHNLHAPLPLRSITYRGISVHDGLSNLSSLATSVDQVGLSYEDNPADSLIASFLCGQTWRHS
ncbi:hypothetical protein EXIGLDRAFT_830127 [Exidia glandulosa HHB12029]|uniref:F-box domain-containing protein n=1 Tax=Exidia glandulosa HHB12029 TaxID=1314781 RepID=A0A165NYW5_EXIGL|nr:hypothetical protein EXIGLDRAFT_830127 [Exidia glandulosa HHB12029]